MRRLRLFLSSLYYSTRWAKTALNSEGRRYMFTESITAGSCLLSTEHEPTLKNLKKDIGQ